MLAEPPHLFTDSPADSPAPGRVLSSLPPAYQALLALLPTNALLIDLPSICEAAHGALAELLAGIDRLPTELPTASPTQVKEARNWCALLAERLTAAQTLSQELLDSMAEIDGQAETYFQEMSFHFLYDPQRQLFRIGYNVSAAVADNNFYDLLASEARIASLVALAKHEVPRSHWLHLGRPLTQVNGTRTLLSWSATMFEYLMPTLIMRNPATTPLTPI
jgi:cyclic beta-1,2-glucan synthetase